MSEVININGTKYTEEDFNEEQRYLLRQIRSCKTKAAQLTFDLDQVKVAEQAFSQGFLVSVEAEKEKEESTEVENAPIENEPEELKASEDPTVEEDAGGDANESVEGNSNNESNDIVSDDESKEKSS